MREEMNRADRLKAEGEGRRGNVVGFALTVLQRRLASSPEAIYQSLRRRRERLETRLNEERLGRRGREEAIDLTAGLEAPEDVDDLPEGELEELEEEVVDQASAAQDDRRARVRDRDACAGSSSSPSACVARAPTRSGRASPSCCRTARPRCSTRSGKRRKLIIFTEHRDTLNYLADRIRTLLGQPEAVVEIHGGMRRELRREAQESFLQDPDVHVLVATDAAGEGVNLQRAHLLVNYDLPWNPNRIEQRFGRIHRIGQTEVCHMWNLVAHETREGQVFERLLEKLAEQSQGARRTGLRRARRRDLRGHLAPRPPDRGRPLRRPARGAGAARPGRRRRRRREAQGRR